MSNLMEFFVQFWEHLPWMGVALMAALSLHKRRESKTLMLQACGAAAMFTLEMGHWLLRAILAWMRMGSMTNAVDIIFRFLIFVALLAFASGYCAERFARRKPAEVTATPA